MGGTFPGQGARGSQGTSTISQLAPTRCPFSHTSATSGSGCPSGPRVGPRGPVRVGGGSRQVYCRGATGLADQAGRPGRGSDIDSQSGSSTLRARRTPPAALLSEVGPLSAGWPTLRSVVFPLVPLPWPCRTRYGGYRWWMAITCHSACAFCTFTSATFLGLAGMAIGFALLGGVMEVIVFHGILILVIALLFMMSDRKEKQTVIPRMLSRVQTMKIRTRGKKHRKLSRSSSSSSNGQRGNGGDVELVTGHPVAQAPAPPAAAAAQPQYPTITMQP